ncbi:FMN-binding glutamate synthase family protein [Pseudomaricurvus alkylphenolicus]|uniref:FMN-binding glutamate synthase family protein n=1 Tax=Pseudomaricurvus alkylphenolicus TaxID=1306991 RepID=UPI0014245EBE|nr:FMN-binding glutamate synthase family protein [Pseudomaricurvus alkylphenolicus]NIB42206.1 FMN-binding glutamate synthase family protein [Pseudomaricurvus alkylphenolicus]
MENLQQLAQAVIQWTALTLLFLFGIGILILVALYLIDKTQTKQTIRRNYPVVGRFRYAFEHLGEFFRQYFFAMDREELPFNRAERSWVYRAAKQVDTTIAFGSTRSLTLEGEPIFLNSAFPTLEDDVVEPRPVTIGEGVCIKPYSTKSLLNISGMSFGAISKPAVLALSHGARQAGNWLNTGEGGLSPYHLRGGCDLVYQIGTAKYGVRNSEGKLCDAKLKEIASHEQVRMFEIKMSQGAKPGKGGILPGAKVTEEIAEIRGIAVGQDSISPNRHEEVRSVDDLLDMINRIRSVTGKPVGFKMVVGQLEFFDDLFKAIHARGIDQAPDFITIDSADGGTGAAPQPLMDYMGMTLRESLPLVVDLLHEYGLRERIKVIASGKLITPGKVAWAISAGADFCTSARGFMFALGCIQALQCNKNTCPTGITTHKKELQRGLVLEDKTARVAAYAKKINYGVGLIAHSCGVSQPRELQRCHVRVVETGGFSRSMAEQFPVPETKTEYIKLRQAD